MDVTTLFLALTLASGPAAWALYLLRLRTLRGRARARHPSRSRLAYGLEYPVYMPPGHPERFPELDVHDVELAELCDDLWTREEWLAVADCPRPELTGHLTPEAAELAVDRSRRSTTRLCACGLVHIHYRRRRKATR